MQVDPPDYVPDEQTLIELLIKDSAMKFIDNINTPVTESLFDVVTAAFKKAASFLKTKEAQVALNGIK
jgi:penicillin amidase